MEEVHFRLEVELSDQQLRVLPAAIVAKPSVVTVCAADQRDDDPPLVSLPLSNEWLVWTWEEEEVVVTAACVESPFVLSSVASIGADGASTLVKTRRRCGPLLLDGCGIVVAAARVSLLPLLGSATTT